MRGGKHREAELAAANVKAAMMSLGRFCVGRTASCQQRHVARIIAGSGRSRTTSIDSSTMKSRGHATTGGAIESVNKALPRLAGGRSMTASSMVPEKLVAIVPWVPAPLQPIMDKLHPVMIKERKPLAWLGVNTATNAGALCGHASFAILTAAYLETDVLTLR